MVEPRGSRKNFKSTVHLPPPDGTFSLFFPSRFSLLYLLYLFCCSAARLLGCSTLQYTCSLIVCRLSGYTLHAFLQQRRSSPLLSAFPPFRSLPYSLAFPLARFFF
ncbi:hypothetical protein N7519_011287 [Penicillium mononematosum]|uniref:uncharacterized protein n=1 Tax=Penicillium mononematosum TaxID=268346 RepID=UPI002548122C|nr:uncharacterized protein N7519_011287 [Penicillium mononematosum]KAJ6180826.1 hypothetical protein N7519_011287 [Penicillium mononematosum]